MAKLYELTHALDNFELIVDEETGEILNGDELDKIEIERNEKIENIALWIKNLNSDAEAYEKEEKAFASKKKTAKNKAEWLKGLLEFNLAGESWKSDRVTISYRKSESVNVSEGAVVPAEFLVPQEPKVDKVGLKKAIKEGQTFDGITIVEKQNMQIK